MWQLELYSYSKGLLFEFVSFESYNSVIDCYAIQTNYLLPWSFGPRGFQIGPNRHDIRRQNHYFQVRSRTNHTAAQ